MATAYLSFDGFIESPKKDFVESPKKERNESGTPFTYSYQKNIFVAWLTRHHAGLPSGHGRTKFDIVFSSKNVLWETTADNPYTGEDFYESWETINKFDGSVSSSGEDGNSSLLGSLIPPGYEYQGATLTQNDDYGIIQVETWHSFIEDDDVTCTTTWYDPYPYSEWAGYLSDIYDAKIAGWVADVEAGTASFGIDWTYDGSGTIVSGGFPGVSGSAEYWAQVDGDGLYETIWADATSITFTAATDPGCEFFVRPVLYDYGDDTSAIVTGTPDAVAHAALDVPIFFYPAYPIASTSPLHQLLCDPYVLDILFEDGQFYGIISLPP